MNRPPVLAALLLLAGCAKAPAPQPAATQEHAPKTPHGGQAVEVGDFNLEAVIDPSKGSVEIYVLDDDLENFIRISQPQLKLVLTDQASTAELVLPAIASAATGETVGSTSYFAGESAWVRAHPHFHAVIEKVGIRGSDFSGVSFGYPP